MPKTPVETITSLLVECGILSADQIAQAMHGQRDPHDTLDKILVDAKGVSRSTLISLLSDHYKIPFVTLPDKIDVQTLGLVPEHIIDTYKVVPLLHEDGILTLGMTAPDNQAAIDRVAALTGFKVEPRGVLEGDFAAFYQKYFEDSTMTHILKEIELHQGELGSAETPTEEEQARPMIKLVDSLLGAATKKRASDVHIEPQDQFALVRFRIDGVLATQQMLPRAVLPALTARLKVLAGLDITERRVPQDGQFQHKLGERDIDVRMATVPSRYGEKIALRVLDRRNFLMSLDLLGLPEWVQSPLEAAVSRPNGLVLVTGPTGSGKTTTMYAVIQKLRSPKLNIVTLEDPIEYELLAGSRREGGITQIQTNAKLGLTFESGLRACLRQDPDVIFIGEMRDRETVETAISASLTGHMVLSTLHTNGALQTIVRLIDMGVEPFLIASAVRAIVSQRLIRVLCHHCKKAYQPPAESLKRLGLPAAEGVTFFKPQGCAACQREGYWGRTGVYELVTIDPEINRLILEKRPAGEIYARAVAGGFRSLKHHGMELVNQGVTTVEEVLRVLPSL